MSKRATGYILFLTLLLLLLIFALSGLSDALHGEIKEKEVKILEQEEIIERQKKEYEKLKTSKAKEKLAKQEAATSTTPTQTPQIQAANVPIGKEKIVKKIQAVFGSDPRILTLVNCESGFIPTNTNWIDTNGGWSSGLFQINYVHGQTAQYWWDVDRNIQKAWELSNGGTNWNPWPSCRYVANL